VLEAWGEAGSALARRLERLAVSLAANFPRIPAPSADQRMDDVLRGQLSTGYVSACLGTRRAPGLNAEEHAGIAELRVWLLIKSLEFTAAGTVHDASLRELANHLRHGLDGVDSDKLAWFRRIAVAAGARGPWEQSLQHRAVADAAAADWQKKVARSIQALLIDERRPIAGLNLAPSYHYVEESTEDELTPSSGTQWSEDEPLVLLGQGDEDDFVAEMSPVPAEAFTPAEAVVAARGIAMLGLEDRQFLPFSWNRPRPDEHLALMDMLGDALTASDNEKRTLAALALLSILTRTSLRQVVSIPIRRAVGLDWGLDIGAGTLHREPSRRSVRWKASEVSAAWIRPCSSSWVLQLPLTLAHALRTAHTAVPDAEFVGQLWTHDKSAELSFNHWCDSLAKVSRLSSGLVPRLAEQLVFQESSDPVHARLATAPSAAGIPGAGAYPSWSSLQVDAAFRAVLPSIGLVAADANDNSLGSELDPDDRLLREAFSQAKQRIDDLPDNAWVEYHNLLVGFVAAFLLAATGGRPVRSPFETSSHIELEGLRIFIEDKASSSGVEGSSARVVPLQAEAARLLQDIYLPHLMRVGRDISRVLPELGAEIQAQAQGVGSSKIPLLFFLSNDDWFDWYEVSEDRLKALSLFRWPLPWNLFRHRLATRLRTIGLDPELIDAQLGHSEAGVQTFGDYSPRCWVEDCPAWAQALQATLDMLDVQLPLYREIPAPKITLEPGYQPWGAQLMGSAAREFARRHRRDQARVGARREIEATLAGRPPASLAPKEWTELGRRMLLRDDNLPHAHATIRYEVLEQFTQRLWSQEGVNIRLKHRRAQPPGAPTFFLPAMLRAEARLASLKSALDAQIAVTPQSGNSNRTCAVLCALDIALYGRIADPQLLVAILNPGLHQLSLIVCGQDGYLHYSAPQEEQQPRLPIQRFNVPSRSVRLLQQALSAERKSSDDAVPDWLLGACADVGIAVNGFEGVVAEIARIVDQDNRLRLPGLVAGLLGGRVKSYALWAEDWQRATDGQARISPETDSNEAAPEVVGDLPVYVGGAIQADARLQADRALLSSIRAALRIRQSDDASRRTSQNAVGKESPLRRQVRSQVSSALHKGRSHVSPAVHALGSWVLHLLSRPSRGKLLDQTSVGRYLSALSPGFLAFGVQLDLGDLDEEEITDFYAQVIDPSLTESSNNEDAEEPAAEEPAGVGKTQAARRYVLLRLREFHRFAEVQYGLARPDWSELDQGLTGLLGNPGLITFDEYHHALKCLSPSPGTDLEEAVRNAFVLLLIFRFGLRGSEAISLDRSDWVDVTGSVVVLVTGRHRKLKTQGSQRQVPLLGSLTLLEQEVIGRWLEHWHAVSGGDARVPLFFHEEDHRAVADLATIRRTVIDTLRHVTGSSHTNMHHARHSFANIAAQLVVLPQQLDPWPAVWHEALPSAQSTRRLLLCTERPTRRALWAVARLLGHSMLETTVGSYLHVLHEWSDACVRCLHPSAFGHVQPQKFESDVRVDRWPLLAESQRPRLPRMASSTEVLLTPAGVIRYFSLRARGVPPRVARLECRVSKGTSDQMEATLFKLAGRLGLDVELGEQLGEKIAVGAVLSKIQVHRWNSLIALASDTKALDRQRLVGCDELLALLSKNRQVLVWDVSHLDLISEYLRCCNWSWHEVDVYQRPKPHPRIAASLDARGIKSKRTIDPATKKKLLQIDVAVIELPGKLPVQTPAHAAVVRGRELVSVQDNYELIIFWMSLSLSPPALA
jgi:integrase